MIKVSIVEDSKEECKELRAFLDEWNTEKGGILVCREYSNAVSFLEKGAMDTDIVFMDIRMPKMTGMKAAEELRKVNSYSALIFLTSFAGYAIRGYSVGAMDYILKPIKKERFTEVLEKAIKSLGKKRAYLPIETKEGLRQVAVDEIKYIEAYSHDKIFHVDKTTFAAQYDMDTLKSLLPPVFVRCHRSYFVNLNYIKVVCKDSIMIMGEDTPIPVSRNRRDALIDALAVNIAGNM